MRGKTILITGGTGSLGQKLAERILKKRPKKVIIFSRGEHKQVEMQLLFPNPQFPIRYIIGDVRDREALYRAFSNVDMVVHTAALKHVPVCEYSSFEAVKTNVMGAQNIINAAIDCGVKKVLAVSSDKAVNPCNLYGATKLCSDKLFIAGNNYSGKHGTIFSVIRFGNFAFSNGSVVGVFQSLKESGEKTFPITSHKMTRFFISIDEAVSRVFETLCLMRGGEIFSPKMGSMKITDVAKAILPDVKFKEIGVRSGERYHEEMIISDDAHKTYDYKNFYITFNGNKETIGKKVPYNFSYSSDNNKIWIDKKTFLEMI